MRRSGSKRLFLSSEFPGSRLAAIPGTGVTFPAELTEQGGWGGHLRTHTLAHEQTTHVDAHTYAHFMCKHAHTTICALVLFSKRLNKYEILYSHTITNTHFNVHVHVSKAQPNIK